MIDFETCGAGDPACDLFPVWYLLPANVRDEFRAALDVDDMTWLRGRGRVLSQALGPPDRDDPGNDLSPQLRRRHVYAAKMPAYQALSAGDSR